MTNTIITPEVVERMKRCEAIFVALREQQKYENKLLEVGFNFEYGEGPVGEFFEANKNALIDTLEYLLGFERVSYKVQTNVFGQMIPCTLEILMPEDGDIEFAISEDDFCECLYKAIDDEKLSRLAIKTWVEKNEIAKKELNDTLGVSRTSPKVGVRSLLEIHGLYQEGE